VALEDLEKLTDEDQECCEELAKKRGHSFVSMCTIAKYVILSPCLSGASLVLAVFGWMCPELCLKSLCDV